MDVRDDDHEEKNDDSVEMSGGEKLQLELNRMKFVNKKLILS